MDETPDQAETRGLRTLRRLVTVLTATMILAGLVLIAVFVTRFPGSRSVPLPEAIDLPDGTRATAFTRGPDWYAVVTGANQILILDAASGRLRQTIAIE